MLSKNPNPAHEAIAGMEKRLKPQGRSVVVITQNIDELHKRAGSEDILELHGEVLCVYCVYVVVEIQQYIVYHIVLSIDTSIQSQTVLIYRVS